MTFLNFQALLLLSSSSCHPERSRAKRYAIGSTESKDPYSSPVVRAQ